MTRSHKLTTGERASHGIETSTAPYKAKKDGGGKGNWGREGDEIEDFIEEEHITTSKPRRRSNSNSNVANGNGGAGGAGAGTTAAGAVKSKFEVNDIDEEAVDEQQQ